jgi:hypothetical protein
MKEGNREKLDFWPTVLGGVAQCLIAQYPQTIFEKKPAAGKRPNL